MNQFVKHIQHLLKAAENLAEGSSDGPLWCNGEQKDCSNCGGENWLNVRRQKAENWTGKPLVVLSLFDGIGGVWVALENLNIPFIGYSCEVDPDAIQVTKQRHVSVRHLGDVQKLKKEHIKEKLDLVVGGFPCQDLSCLGVRMGLHGNRSRLFFDMLRIIKTFKPTWFLAENVASMHWTDQEEISRHLSTTPIEIDSQEFTPAKRRRLYWSNIPYPRISPRIRYNVGTSMESVLQDAIAPAAKSACILSQNSQRASKVSLDLVIDRGTKKQRYMTVVEVERIMGYPSHYTNVEFEGREPVQFLGSSLLPKAEGVNRNLRWRMLGNTFSVPVITYLLSPLLEPDVRTQTAKIVLPKSVREQDCSVMAPGEVWATYNDHKRANWYVQIVNRSGERFSEVNFLPGKTKRPTRPPLRIEAKYLELTKAYGAGERNLRDTIRGTGCFHLTDNIESHKTWVVFSHRVTTFLSCDEDTFFIYPGKDEVWSVYDSGTKSRYLVYVVESSVHKQNARAGIPGKEEFSARCRLLQKRREVDLHEIIDKELEYTDLGVFSYRTPYHRLNERNVLKVELFVKERGRGAHADKQRGRGVKRNADSEDEELFQLESEDENAI